VLVERIEVSEDCIAYIVREKGIDELGETRLPSSLIIFTTIHKAKCYSETPVYTGSKRRHIPEDGILHSRRCENLKSYIALHGWAL
jgi:hypothetical protein